MLLAVGCHCGHCASCCFGILLLLLLLLVLLLCASLLFDVLLVLYLIVSTNDNPVPSTTTVRKTPTTTSNQQQHSTTTTAMTTNMCLSCLARIDAYTFMTAAFGLSINANSHPQALTWSVNWLVAFATHEVFTKLRHMTLYLNQAIVFVLPEVARPHLWVTVARYTDLTTSVSDVLRVDIGRLPVWQF